MKTLTGCFGLKVRLTSHTRIFKGMGDDSHFVKIPSGLASCIFLNVLLGSLE
jgi:hypothetical protein